MHQNIEIDQDVIDTFNGIKMKGTNTYMVLKINEASRVVIEHVGAAGASWEEMCDKLPDDDGRYIVFDYKKKLDDGRVIARLLFTYWCPDSVKITRKVQLSSNKVPVEAKVPCQISIACSDRSDLEAAEVERSIK